MDDREFFNLLLESFKATTRAADAYWEPAQHGDSGTWSVFAVSQDGKREAVAVAFSQADAEFVCGIHGALPELVRRLNMALDEADRADAERDERELLIAQLLREAK